MIEQVLANGIAAGCMYGLVAVGFALIYSTAKFFHFAHGAVYASGPYAAYAFIQAGVPALLAFPLAVSVAAVFGAILDILVYRPLRRRRSPSVVFLVASLGLLVVFQNLTALIFGDATKVLRTSRPTKVITLFQARLTSAQISIIFASLFCCALLSVLAQKTQFGRTVRAVANDPELAHILGIRTDRVLTWIFAIGSAFAGIAGILVAYDIDLKPTMGFQALLGAVVAMIVGGVGSIQGAFIGGLFVGIVQHLSVWILPSRWEDAVLFVVLIVFLLLRPQGFFGKPRQLLGY